MRNDEPKRYYWIKLKKDFFDLAEIDFLLSQKNGSEYIVIYQMLCLITINDNGSFTKKVGEVIIPFDIQKIQRETKHFNIDTIRVALELFKKLGLIYEDEGKDTLKISNFDTLIGGETKWAEIKRGQRAKEIEELSPNKQDKTNKYIEIAKTQWVK